MHPQNALTCVCKAELYYLIRKRKVKVLPKFRSGLRTYAAGDMKHIAMTIWRRNAMKTQSTEQTEVPAPLRR